MTGHLDPPSSSSPLSLASTGLSFEAGGVGCSYLDGMDHFNGNSLVDFHGNMVNDADISLR